MDAIAEEITRRGFERFLLFTDAVVAIAVTLLILPVVDAVLQADAASTLDLLDQLQGELFGFLLSFAVIVVLWLAHQQVFARVVEPSPELVWLNVGWLLSIILLPCSTALIADHGNEQATVLLYVGNVALSMYCLGGALWVLVRHPHLLVPGGTVTPDDRHEAMINSALVTLAFILALLVPALNFWVMTLLFLTRPLKRRWHQARPPRQPDPGVPPA
jgi:uncharacterized membrane protein